MPDRAGQMRPEGGHALHPHQRQLAQGGQLGGLGVGAEQRDVLAHRVLHLVVVWQGRARRQGQLFECAALGGAVFQPFFDHEHGGRGGNFGFECVQHQGRLARGQERGVLGGLCWKAGRRAGKAIVPRLGGPSQPKFQAFYGCYENYSFLGNHHRQLKRFWLEK